MNERPISAVARALGVTGPVPAGLLLRATQIATTVVTLVCVVVLLSPAQQGYFFTFMGLLAAQQLLELGVPLVIMQVASHHSAGIGWNGQSARFEKPGSAQPLAALFAGAVRWYGGVAAAFLCTVLPAGWFVLSSDVSPDSGQFWQGAWLLAVVVLALNLAFTPALALLEGCGRISQVFVFKSWQEAGASLALWLSLLSGAGLYGIGIYLAMRAATSTVYLARYRHFFAALRRERTEAARGFLWSRDIWPFQWRISVSWAAGYLIFQLTTPIVFGVLGPIAAGQWALTYMVFYQTAQFWLIWVSARAPELGKLAAQAEYREMERVFFSAAIPSIFASATGLGSAYLLLMAAHYYRLPYFDRFVEPLPTAMLVVWALVNQVVSMMAVYLRAHREEPYLLPSLAGGILVPLGVFILGSRFGMEGVAASYLVSGCLVGLGWGGVIFRNKIAACRALAARNAAL